MKGAEHLARGIMRMNSALPSAAEAADGLRRAFEAYHGPDELNRVDGGSLFNEAELSA